MVCGLSISPEFLSRPLKPHPLFKDFIKAARKHKKTNKQSENV